MELPSSLEASFHIGPMQRFIDGFEHDFRLRKNVIVPEAQYTESFGPEKGIASSVIRRLLDMLASIQLDNDTRFDAGEVTYVRADGVLPSKLETGDLPASQSIPK